MSDLTTFEREAIRLALVKMFGADGHFSICTIDDCCKLAGVTVPDRTYSALRALHCVHWSTMTPAMKQEVANTVLGLFALPTTDLSALHRSFLEPVRVVESDAPKRNVFRRLLARGAA